MFSSAETCLRYLADDPHPTCYHTACHPPSPRPLCQPTKVTLGIYLEMYFRALGQLRRGRPSTKLSTRGKSAASCRYLTGNNLAFSNIYSSTAFPKSLNKWKEISSFPQSIFKLWNSLPHDENQKFRWIQKAVRNLSYCQVTQYVCADRREQGFT